MAILGTLTHRKTRKLARLLSTDPPRALGLLEALWHVTAEHACDGGIGKLSDEEIADEMFYSGDPAVLVAGFIDSDWLDEDNHHRLIVHDWPEHCPDHIHNRLARAHKRFACGAEPNTRRMSKEERSRLELERTNAHVERTESALEHTNLSGPVPTQPGPTGPVRSEPASCSSQQRDLLDADGRRRTKSDADGQSQTSLAPSSFVCKPRVEKPSVEKKEKQFSPPLATANDNQPLGEDGISAIRRAWEATGAPTTEKEWNGAVREFISQSISEEVLFREVLPGLESQIGQLRSEGNKFKFLGNPANWAANQTWRKFQSQPKKSSDVPEWKKPKPEQWAIDGAKRPPVDET